MHNKHLRHLLSPIYIKIQNKKILKFRSKKKPTTDWDKIIPDTRHLHDSIEDQIKCIGLRILRIIDTMSKNYNFKYSLAYGTLLGAIRHDGFIPWDDDIDIFMSKDDFNKFLYHSSHDLPSSTKFFAQGVGFFKVMDRFSLVSKDGKRGVAVDIFIRSKDQEKISFHNVHTLKKVSFKKSVFINQRTHDFENYQFLIPNKPEVILEEIYGDFMQLPPKNQRVAPHSNMNEVKIFKYKSQPQSKKSAN
jgi:phosphorylcholine metabolism protein LicD